jgi:hypothetical protein
MDKQQQPPSPAHCAAQGNQKSKIKNQTISFRA